jgi:uncharacterized protein (DUF2141 family)
MLRRSTCTALLGAMAVGVGGLGCATPNGTPQPRVAQVGRVSGHDVSAAPTGDGAAPDTIAVTVVGLRSDAGTVRCFLYDSAEHFPDSKEHVIGKAVAIPSGRRGTCSFVNVGRDHDYAIVVLHDENNDGVFQKNALGMPEEGYGFSNDAHAHFSAPSFDACRVRFTRGTLPLAITMQY